VLGLSPLLGAPPSPTPSPSQEKIVPGSSVVRLSDKQATPIRKDVESPKHSFLAPSADFARDSILRPKKPFALVPSKDPNDWAFVLEPYGWTMGLAGEVDVSRFPAVNVDVSAISLPQHLDWAVFARGEVRKGRWGVLADGFYAELSALGELAGILYKSAHLTVQQGLASLALAYRIIDDRRGFLDFYAGARDNYLGVQISSPKTSKMPCQPPAPVTCGGSIRSSAFGRK
jgi:hypothetical protein